MTMRTLSICCFASVCCLMSVSAPAKPAGRRRAVPPPTVVATPKTPFEIVLAEYQKKNYVAAAKGFFPMAQKNDAISHKAQLYLGISLYRLGLFQTASFQLVEALQAPEPKIRKLATDFLMAAADTLDDSTLLDYALSKYQNDQLTEIGANALQLRQAQNFERAGQLTEATKIFEAILPQFKKPEEILYSLGSIALRKNEPLTAVKWFENLSGHLNNLPVTSQKRAQASLAVARSYYQAHKWKEAIEIYRSIPKDNPLYFDSLTELSWSYFRNGMLRSALSPLQSLHSPYFAHSYNPESLLLRGTILLLICKYDEIEQLITTYDEAYGRYQEVLQDYLKSNPNPDVIYQKLSQTVLNLANLKKGKAPDWNDPVPFYIYRHIVARSDVQQRARLLTRLVVERDKVRKLFSNSEPLARYSLAVINQRKISTRRRIGEISLTQIQRIVSQLNDISTEMDFLKYEMTNGRRRSLKVKITESKTMPKSEAELSRTYYIQNGFRYWPFDGEYWRDEVGNYQYVGENSCVSTN